MAHQLFSETDDWELESSDQDIRGYQVVDEQGGSVGTVRDMYVDTDTETIDRLVLDNGQEIDVNQASIENGTIQVGSMSGFSSDTTTDVDTTTTATTGATSSAAGLGDTLRIRRHAEELRAETRPEQVGEVRIEKDVVERQAAIDVPVTHEEVEVRRFATDRPAESGAEPTQHESIRVPVMAERVEVAKEARVVEEVEIAKTARTDTERVSDTVRHEELDVTQVGNARVVGDRVG